MRHFFDFNAGTILQGESVESVGGRLYDLVIEVINGRQTLAERNGCREFTVPYQVGRTYSACTDGCKA